MKQTRTVAELKKSIRVDPISGCWLWTKSTERPPLLPYGRVYFGKRYKAAHRVMWEAANGPIPEGLCVCHHCDVPNCINPDHLFLDTAEGNNADRDEKGRTARGERSGRYTKPEATARGDRHYSKTKPHLVPRGERHGRTHLTEIAVADMRSKRASGRTLTSLAEEFSVSESTAGRICRGESWQ